MNKLKTFVLAVIGLLCSLSVSAHDFAVNGLYYNILSEEDKTVEITYWGSNHLASYNEYQGHVVIPETIEYQRKTYTVVAIGKQTFGGCEKMTGVTIPNTIKKIGDGAFGVNEYGGVEFSNVDIADLEAWCNIEFEDYVATPLCLAENFYLNGQLLTDIVIPERVTEIKEYAFAGFSGESITIPKSVTSIEAGAFSQSSALIIFLNETPITYNSFLVSSSIVIVPENSLETYRNTDGWKNISDRILTEKLYNLNIEVIASNSESAVSKYLEENNITTVCNLSIKGTINSYDIIVLNNEMPYLRNLDLSEAQIVACDYPYYNPYREEGICTVDNTLSSYMFYQNKSLRSIKLPKQIKGEMGKSVFYQCSNLHEVVLPSGITSIGDYAFYYCKALRSINIPTLVTSIGYRAFDDCTYLTSIEIPNRVTRIDDFAFQDCENLTSIFSYISGRDLFSITDASWDSEDDEWRRGVFAGVDFNKCTLYVPYQTKDTYASTNGWEDFKNIVEMELIKVPNYILTDVEEYNEILGKEIEILTYTRTLPNLYWNALYVPFELPYDVIADRYDVAYINDVNGYDTDGNGTIDDLAMEIITIKGGTLKANYPYLIKAKTEADKAMSITVEDATLYAAEENAVDCSSVYQNYVVKGTYTKKTAEELAGKLAISTSGAWQPLAEGTALNPFRLYLSIENRDNSPLKVEPAALSRMRIVERGETTGIEEVVPSQQREDIIFDLSGRRVKQPVKGGVYIVNGKKRIL